MLLDHLSTSFILSPKHKVNKKGFTLIELIMVLVIMGIIFTISKPYFQIGNKDVIYGQTCVENIYGDVNNFLNAAATSKGFGNINNTRYRIKFIFGGNSIRYFNAEDKVTESPVIKLYYLTGYNSPANYYCKSNSYGVRIESAEGGTSNLELITNKGFKNFELSPSGYNTILFKLYPTGNSVGKLIGKFIIDTRTQSISKYICLRINATNPNNCDERDK